MRLRKFWVYGIGFVLAASVACGGGSSAPATTAAPAASGGGKKVDAATAGEIKGTVALDGVAPKNADIKMNAEVTENLLGQKMMRRYGGQGGPNSQAIRAGHANLPIHLDYIGYLVERRRWLAGDHFSIADITAAVHLSSLDYLGDVPWDAHDPAKEWYARIKSRPSFRQILADHVPGAPPPKHYADLDF